MSLRESVKLDALSGMRRELERLGIDPRDWFSREKGQRVWLVELLPFQGAVPFQGAEPRKFYDGDTFFSGDRRTAIWNENGKRFRSRRSALGALNREVGRGVPRARLVLVESVEFEPCLSVSHP